MKFFALAQPHKFKKFTRPLLWVSIYGAIASLIIGLYLALIASPADYQQMETVRIMYIHVPAAWISLLCYTSIGFAGLSHIIWRHTLAGLYLKAAAPVGAIFTLICLVTGSIWGEPTWGTWWVWDARLTSVLVLFFLYIGIIVICDAFNNQDKGLFAASWLAVIGIVNLPIIKFSVTWWNTLHQPASLTSFSKLAQPAIHTDMLKPLLTMALCFLFLFISLIILRMNNELLERAIENRNHRDIRRG